VSAYQTAKIVYKKGLQATIQHLKDKPIDQIHGSELHDVVLNAYIGSYHDSSTTEKIIRGLVEIDVLSPLELNPTRSQVAFSGLQYSSKGYKSAGKSFETAYGLQTHFWFKIDRYKLAELLKGE